MAGGVALNCVANGRLLREGPFENIWIQPAAGDAGGALGAALSAWYQNLGKPRNVSDVCRGQIDGMKASYLGPSFSEAEITGFLDPHKARYRRMERRELVEWTAQQLAQEKVVGWFQGRMEFGPRALGNRSILADPRSATMQKDLNLKIKYRESFRPFAPAVLREDVAEWFEMDGDSPYMLLVADVAASRRRDAPGSDELFGIDKLNRARSTIPAVTHVDHTARIQTVHRETNPRFHARISRFKALTGCPVLVNTSFNVRGEPIVCTPVDAFRCFMGCELDTLVVGNCVLAKAAQDPTLRIDYKDRFELD
jgi:carbamoyltransferase